MSKSSILEKVRIPRIRLIEPTPKEREDWAHFVLLTKELSDGKNGAPAFVQAELDRLADKGNPLALRLKKRIEASNYNPRATNQVPISAPTPRRITHVIWGKGETDL